MDDSIEPMPNTEQQLAEQLVEQAGHEGANLVGPGTGCSRG